ncbi:MAG: uncharacterized protein JWO36_4488 [Myxococcales bacterium]|nr:uncharacterized protein [Myxococcales bacterium]
MRPSTVIALGLLVGCATKPTATGTVCPDPDPNTLTYENFGKPFMTRYCTWCHDSHLVHSQRNGATIYHDVDTLELTLRTWQHIDEQAGIGPKAENFFMPGSQCPSVAGGPLDKNCDQPTDEERRNLAMWLACEHNRPHNFSDAGVD